MKIKLKSTYNSPAGSFKPGENIEVHEIEGAQLIAGSYAEPLEECKGGACAIETTDADIKDAQPHHKKRGGK